eukprot:65808-Rhodomonas_salina.5
MHFSPGRGSKRAATSDTRDHESSKREWGYFAPGMCGWFQSGKEARTWCDGEREFAVVEGPGGVDAKETAHPTHVRQREHGVAGRAEHDRERDDQTFACGPRKQPIRVRSMSVSGVMVWGFEGLRSQAVSAVNKTKATFRVRPQNQNEKQQEKPSKGTLPSAISIIGITESASREPSQMAVDEGPKDPTGVTKSTGVGGTTPSARPIAHIICVRARQQLARCRTDTKDKDETAQKQEKNQNLTLSPFDSKRSTTD